MAKTVFSCAAASLNKHNNGNYNLFKELPNRAAYRNGDITAWRTPHKSFLYCYKNIAITELTGLSKDFLDALTNGKAFKYEHIIKTAKDNISNAEQYAKEYGFKLENV